MHGIWSVVNELRNLFQQFVEVEHRRDLATKLEERDDDLARFGGAGVGVVVGSAKDVPVVEPKYNLMIAMDLTLPLDYAAIERILPHRYPFLLVDRITEFEVGQADRRHQERVAERTVPVARRRRPAGAAADDPHGGGRAGRRDPDSRQARKPPAAPAASRAFRRCATAGRFIPATSSRSRRPSCGCAAGWVCSRALRASTAAGHRRHHDVRAGQRAVRSAAGLAGAACGTGVAPTGCN